MGVVKFTRQVETGIMVVNDEELVKICSRTATEVTKFGDTREEKGALLRCLLSQCVQQLRALEVKRD